jgi:hypothetical protein
MASALREKRRRSKSILTIPKRASAARDELLYQASEEEEEFAAPYSVKVLQIHFMLKTLQATQSSTFLLSSGS